MQFPSGPNCAQVVVIEPDKVQEIEEHAAVMGLVEARHTVAIASRDIGAR
jgi:hypothetical protein